MKVFLAFCLSLVCISAGADELDDLVGEFWKAVDEQDARDMRSLAHDDSRHRRLTAYIEGYIAYMARIRAAYPDASQFKFGYASPEETRLYDPTIPALFKAGQLTIYPQGAEGIVTLVLESDGGLQFIDQLVVGRDEGALRIMFPLETIAIAGQQQLFEERARRLKAGESLARMAPLVIHMEPPEYPSSLAGAGQSGCSRVRVSVGPEGNPLEVEVLASEGSKIFGRVTRSALDDWRYAPTGEPASAEHVFSFQPISPKADPAVSGPCGAEEGAIVVLPTPAEGN